MNSVVGKIFCVAALGVLTAACADGNGSTKGDATAGKTAYDATCAVCHGANGGGEAETGYTDATVMSQSLEDHTDAEIKTIILEGVGTMPAQTTVTADAADDIIAYLHEAFHGMGSDTDEHTDM